MYRISHAATVFPVRDIQRCIDFYIHLGFFKTFEWGSPVNYIVLKLGEDVDIHLTSRTDQLAPSKDHVALYIFVEHIDELYKHFADEQISVSSPIGTRDYGMRDFNITDPEGYIICFGELV